MNVKPFPDVLYAIQIIKYQLFAIDVDADKGMAMIGRVKTFSLSTLGLHLLKCFVDKILLLHHIPALVTHVHTLCELIIE